MANPDIRSNEIILKPGLFLDRDGVLNVDIPYLFKPEEFQWMPGAIETVRIANTRGWYVFVVTNQSGVARGKYGIREVEALHAFMQHELKAQGAHIDDFRYCPYLKEGVVPEYAMDSNWRKPAPGMILDIFEKWPVDRTQSLMIGDRDNDVHAARNAGIKGLLFTGGRLDEFVAPYLFAVNDLGAGYLPDQG
jgi:D-glycero-D-manno-heptose 1,7-bisphosphate phosphatase